MSDNVRQISDHPKYQPPLDPSDPNFERDRYLAMLDAGMLPPPVYHEPYDEQDLDEYHAGVLEDLEERPPIESLEEEPVSEPVVGLSICADCEFKKDPRPRWKRLLFPMRAWTLDLLCQASPKSRLQSPITGESNYPPCIFINTTGTCRLFKPKTTYR